MISSPLTNPEFIRLRRSKLRVRNMVLLGVTAVILVGGIAAFFVFLNSVGTFPKPIIKWIDCYQAQLAILGYGSAYYGLVLASQSVALEKERFTFDFQRMVAMGPWQLAIGKLFGSACEALFGLFIASLCTLPTAFLSGIHRHHWILIQIVMFSTLLLFIAVGLASSSLAARANHAAGIGLLLGGTISALFSSAGATGSHFFSAAHPAQLISSYLTESRGGSVASPCRLFGLTFPMLAAFLLIHATLTFGFLSIVVRKLTDDEFSLLSGRQTACLFGIAQFFMIGTLVDELVYSRNNNFGGMLAVYHLVNIFLLTLCGLMLIPSSELLAGRLSRGRPGEHWRILVERTNRYFDAPPLTSVALFCAVYLLCALLITLIGRAAGAIGYSHYIALFLPPVVAMASVSFALTLHLYLEKHSFRSTAIILFCAHVLPIPLLLWLAPENLMSLSPSYWIHWMTSSSNKTGFEITSQLCPILCISLMLLFPLLAAMRIRFLLDIARIRSQNSLTSGDKDTRLEQVFSARAKITAPDNTPAQ